MASLLLLIGLLLVATATDVARHRIYNWTTYPGIAAAFAVRTWEDGVTGLQDSLVGFLACGFIMLACLVLTDIGGGDVKLIAMMGAFLGVQRGIEAMLWTFVLGGIAGTVILIWQVGAWRLTVKTWQHLVLVVRSRGWIPPTESEREPLRRWLFLAPAGLAAVVVVAHNQLLHI